MLEELNTKLVKRIEELNELEQYDLGNAYNDFNYLVAYYQAEDTSQTFTDWCNSEKASDILSDITYWLDTVENLANTDVTDEDYLLFMNYAKATIDELAK